MYTIISRERRITSYVKKQAYIWLYKKVEGNEYQGHSNDAKSLLLKIRKDKLVNEEIFEEFLEFFYNDPYSYMLTHDKRKRFNGITTRCIDNFFVSFNGVSLPVGFIKSFFEDDYETQEEIRAFYKLYLNETLNDFIIGAEMQKNDLEKQVEEVEENYAELLHTKIKHHIVNVLIKILLPVVALAVCADFLVDICDTWLQLNLPTWGTQDIQFTDEMIWGLLIYGAATLFTLGPAIKAVKLVVFYLKWLRLRWYLFRIQCSLDRFVSNTVVHFRSHFEEINEFLLEQPVLADDPCMKAPANKRHYLYIINFDRDKVHQKLEKLKNKYRYRVNILGQANRWFGPLLRSVFWAGMAYVWGTPELREYAMLAIAWLQENVFA